MGMDSRVLGHTFEILVEEVMNELLQDLAKKYRSDRIAAGVMVSFLPAKELFYVAVHRFPRGRRRIIASAQGPGLNGTIEAVRKMIEDQRDDCKMAPESILPFIERNRQKRSGGRFNQFTRTKHGK